jgi:hypothetical protein
MAAAGVRWRSAAESVEALVASESGAADGAVADDLPEELKTVADEYLLDPAVKASYSLVPPTIGLVPLNKVVVFQSRVNMGYARTLEQYIGAEPVIDEKLLRFCLAHEQPYPPVTGHPLPNGFVFKSPSADLRFLGFGPVEASQVTGRAVPGRPQAAFVAYVGYSVNAFNVLQVDGRLVLNNGSHRAYALLAAGLTHAPAVVQVLSAHDHAMLPPIV